MYHLRTLGGLSVLLDGLPQDAVGAQRKPMALLAMLAVAGEKGISRDLLATYLWPESDVERSRGALKQALHIVRRHLSSDAIVGTAELRLNASLITSDVGMFLGAVGEGRAERAVGIYGGPFLDGFHVRDSADFEQWVATQRDDLARRYAAALEELARAADSAGDHTAAVALWRRLQGEDPLSARITLGLMDALAAAGERSAAIRCAGIHQTLLREQLDHPPDPAVMALASQLREPAVTGAGPERPKTFPDPVPATGWVAAPAVGVTDGPHDRSTERHRPRRYALGLVILATALALWILSRNVSHVPAPVAPAGVRTIAVLPFVNTHGDADYDHFSDGLTDELIGVLGKVEGLRVAARTSTFALKGRGLSIRAIADTLGVAALLEGAVRREGNRLKVTVQLVNASDSGVLWAEAYDRDLSDVFAVQEEIASAIANALFGEQAFPGSRGRARRPTDDLEAYDLYLQGRHSWTLPPRQRLERAAILYRRAIERDPNFAMAYAGLADTYVNLSNFAYMPSRQALARAKLAAERALELDPTLADAHASHGFVLASDMEFDAADAAFRRAISLNPSYPWGYHYYSLLLMMLGRTDEAFRNNSQVLGLDPLSLPANATRGILHGQARDYARAEADLRRALSLSPDFALTLYSLGALKAATSAFDQALPLLEAAAAEAPSYTGVPGALAFVYYRTGRTAKADSIVAGLESGAESDGRTLVNLAFAHGILGRIETAAALLDRLEWDIPSLITLRSDPLLEQLRSDARYRQLLHRIGAGDP